MYARQVTSDEKFTLYETKKILEKEKEERKTSLLNKVKQVVLGLSLIAIGIMAAILLKDEDTSVSFIIIPMGLYVLFRKENQNGIRRTL